MNGMIDQKQSVDLEKMAKDVEAKVPPQYQREFMALMVAGMKVCWSASTHHLMTKSLAGIKGPQDVPQVVSQGIVKLMRLVLKESKQQKPMPMMPTAALVLMFQALQYVEKRMGIPISKAIIDQTAQLVTKGAFQLYGINQQNIQQAIQAGAQQQPQPMKGTA